MERIKFLPPGATYSSNLWFPFEKGRYADVRGSRRCFWVAIGKLSALGMGKYHARTLFTVLEVPSPSFALPPFPTSQFLLCQPLNLVVLAEPGWICHGSWADNHTIIRPGLRLLPHSPLPRPLAMARPPSVCIDLHTTDIFIWTDKKNFGTFLSLNIVQVYPHWSIYQHTILAFILIHLCRSVLFSFNKL